jgi:hypothetical protein
MYVLPKFLDPDRILLKDRSVTSRAQFARAVVLGGIFALILIWILPNGPAGAEPAPMGVDSNLG